MCSAFIFIAATWHHCLFLIPNRKYIFSSSGLHLPLSSLALLVYTCPLCVYSSLWLGLLDRCFWPLWNFVFTLSLEITSLTSFHVPIAPNSMKNIFNKCKYYKPKRSLNTYKWTKCESKWWLKQCKITRHHR